MLGAMLVLYMCVLLLIVLFAICHVLRFCALPSPPKQLRNHEASFVIVRLRGIGLLTLSGVLRPSIEPACEESCWRSSCCFRMKWLAADSDRTGG